MLGVISGTLDLRWLLHERYRGCASCLLYWQSVDWLCCSALRRTAAKISRNDSSLSLSISFSFSHRVMNSDPFNKWQPGFNIFSVFPFLSPSVGAVRASSIFPILSVILLFMGGLCIAASEFYKSRHNIILSAGILFVSAGESTLNNFVEPRDPYDEHKSGWYGHLGSNSFDGCGRHPLSGVFCVVTSICRV